MSIVYYDLETTGLNQFHDRITEFSFIKEAETTERNLPKLQSLINPGIPIPPFVQKLTNITNELVQNKPIFNQTIPTIMEFMNNPTGQIVYLIAHNNDNFDRLVLNEHFKREGVQMSNFNWKFIDTLLFAKKLYPKIYRFSLAKLLTYLQIDLREAHRAENDTLMVRDLYKRLVKDMAEKEKVDYSMLISNPEYIWQYIYS
jgi:DNA polymerase III alpha subunit (gram-positive type)